MRGLILGPSVFALVFPPYSLTLPRPCAITEVEPEPEVDLSRLLARISTLEGPSVGLGPSGSGAFSSQQDPADAEDVDKSLAYLHERNRERERARAGGAGQERGRDGPKVLSREEEEKIWAGKGGDTVDREAMRRDKEKAEAVRGECSRRQARRPRAECNTSPLGRRSADAPYPWSSVQPSRSGFKAVQLASGQALHPPDRHHQSTSVHLVGPHLHRNLLDQVRALPLRTRPNSVSVHRLHHPAQGRAAIGAQHFQETTISTPSSNLYHRLLPRRGRAWGLHRLRKLGERSSCRIRAWIWHEERAGDRRRRTRRRRVKGEGIWKAFWTKCFVEDGDGICICL